MRTMLTVCGNVDQENVTSCTKSGEITSGLDVELPCALGVLVDLVWEAVGSAVHHNLRPVWTMSAVQRRKKWPGRDGL